MLGRRNFFIATLPGSGIDIPARSIYVPGLDTYACTLISLIASQQDQPGVIELIRPDGAQVARFIVPVGTNKFHQVDSTVTNYPQERSLLTVTLVSGNVYIGSFLFTGRNIGTTYSAVLSPTILASDTPVQTVFIYPGTAATGVPTRVSVALYSKSDSGSTVVEIQSIDTGAILASGRVLLGTRIFSIVELDIKGFPSDEQRVRIIIRSQFAPSLIGTIIDSSTILVASQYMLIPSVDSVLHSPGGTLRPFRLPISAEVTAIRTTFNPIVGPQILDSNLRPLVTVPATVAADFQYVPTPPVSIGIGTYIIAIPVFVLSITFTLTYKPLT